MGYRGERLGLPPSGPGSVAPFGRRLLAILIDWFASLLVVRLAFPSLVPGDAGGSGDYGLATLAVFTLEVAVLTSVSGASFGQRIMGICVRRVDGSRLPVPDSIVRTLLLALAVPALIWDRDARGLHDKAAASVCVVAA